MSDSRIREAIHWGLRENLGVSNELAYEFVEELMETPELAAFCAEVLTDVSRVSMHRTFCRVIAKMREPFDLLAWVEFVESNTLRESA